MSGARPLVGRRFGSYLVQSSLGAGGMGEVYRARDERLGREVAIKILPDLFLADPERRARFDREARVLASLNHSSIGAIFGLEEVDGARALVLELVEGPTLAERLASGPLALSEALAIAAQIADALQAAHAKGIVHRDLKPANIKVTPDGVVKVLDFGLAKLAERDEAAYDPGAPTETIGETRLGLILGTAAYMCPEQARGLSVDTRADIWAFGCVLYEMLTGRRAFDGESASDVLARVLERDPDLGALPAATPPAVRRLLRRSLEKDRKRRLSDIADARLEIEEGRVELTAPAHPVVAPRRRRATLGFAAVVLILATAGVSWLTRGAFPPPAADNPLANAQFTRFTDFEGTELDGAISPDGRFVAFLADRDGTFNVWVSQVGTGRSVNLTAGTNDHRLLVRALGFSADGSEIWLAGAPDRRLRLMPLTGGTPRVFLGEHAINVAWSPDGARLVYHTRDAGDPMFVADGNGANARQIFVAQPGVHNHYPIWSADGRWIYFVQGIHATFEMDLYRITASGGAPERLTEHNGEVAYPTPIDDRTLLYVARAEDRSGPWLWALDVERRVTHRVSFGLERYTSVSASADGRRLVATVANPTATLWSVPILERVASNADVKPFPTPMVRAWAPRFVGTSLFYLSSRGTGDGLWSFQDGQSFEVWKGSEGALLEPPAVSPDGRRAAVVLRKRGILHLNLVSIDGAEQQSLAERIDVRGSSTWSPDSKWIVTGGTDGKASGLFKIPVDGGAPVRLVEGPAFNPVWSPDGSSIVYAGSQVGVSAPLLAVRPDGSAVDLPAIRAFSWGFRFLPDGKGVVYMQDQRGFGGSHEFWLLDLITKKTRQLARLSNPATTLTFDITPDGKEIVFDRLRENSDIVLIDLPKP